MMAIYYVYHRHAFPEYGVEDEVEKLIGIYSSEENAKLAVQRLLPLPGFSKYPDGFEILEGELDRDGKDGVCFAHSRYKIIVDAELLPISSPNRDDFEGSETVIYYLFYTYSYPKQAPYGEDEKLVGIYSSKFNVRLAKRRLAGKPGFSKHPKAFKIMRGRLNSIGWETGFVSFGEMLDSVEN